MIYLFFVLSACFGALTQLVRFEQGGQSWLPTIVFEWDLTHVWSTLDAYHVYQGIWLWLAIVGGYVLVGLIWWGWVILFFSYYVFYNAFYHIVFRKPQFWRWPFG